MTPKNPNKQPLAQSLADLWLATNMTKEWLFVIPLDYHVYSHAIYELSPEELLRIENMDI